jgi:hypothetical protein
MHNAFDVKPQGTDTFVMENAHTNRNARVSGDVINMRHQAQRAVVAMQRHMSPGTNADMHARSQLAVPRAAFCFDGNAGGELDMLDPDNFKLPARHCYFQSWEVIISDGGRIRACLFVDEKGPDVIMVWPAVQVFVPGRSPVWGAEPPMIRRLRSVKANLAKYGHGSAIAHAATSRLQQGLDVGVSAIALAADSTLAGLLGCLAALNSSSSQIIPPAPIPPDTPLKRRRQLEASACTIVRLKP